MNKTSNLQSLEILKTCLHKELKDIYVTGYTEIRENYHYFSTMNWWYYIEFEDFFLCIESSQTNGIMLLHIHNNIQCNFEIEEDDIFTVMTIDKKTYLGQEIIAFDLFYSKLDDALFGLGIQLKDNRYLDKDNKYVFFNALTLDGIDIGNENFKIDFLDDERFYHQSIS